MIIARCIYIVLALLSQAATAAEPLGFKRTVKEQVESFRDIWADLDAEVQSAATEIFCSSWQGEEWQRFGFRIISKQAQPVVSWARYYNNDHSWFVGLSKFCGKMNQAVRYVLAERAAQARAERHHQVAWNFLDAQLVTIPAKHIYLSRDDISALVRSEYPQEAQVINAIYKRRAELSSRKWQHYNPGVIVVAEYFHSFIMDRIPYDFQYLTTPEVLKLAEALMTLEIKFAELSEIRRKGFLAAVSMCDQLQIFVEQTAMDTDHWTVIEKP